MQKAVQLDEKSLVTQSNKLIEARYKMTAFEMKLLRILISTIHKDDNTLEPYRIYVSDLDRVFKLPRKDLYDAIDKGTDALMSRVLRFESDNGSWKKRHFIYSASYDAEEAVLDLQLHEEMHAFLLDQKNRFTQYYLENILLLKGKYAIRIYEMGKEALGISKITKKKYVKISLKNLRDRFDLGSKEYSRFGDFKKRILISSEEEVNEKTDITFSWESIKSGRGGKVKEIIFHFDNKITVEIIDEKKLNDADDIEEKITEKPENKEYFDILIGHGISENETKKWLEKYSNQEIIQVLSLLKAELDRGKTISSPGGWLRRALENSWKDSRSEQKENEQETQKKAREKELEQAQAKALKNAQDDAYSTHRTHCIQTNVKSLTEESERKLRDVLRDTLQAELPQILHKNMKEFHAQGKLWLHPQYRRFVEPLLERENGLEVKSFEQFLAEDFESK